MNGYMKGFALLCCLVFCGAIAEAASLADKSNEFAFKMRREIGASGGGARNTVFSPFSAYQMLGLLYMCSDGEGADEIARLAGFPGREALPGGFNRLISESVGGEEKVKTANSVWLSSLASPNPAFVKMLEDDFHGEFFSSNFLNRDTAASRIDDWASKSTLGLIRSISTDFPPNTAFAVLNASAFIKEWEYKFMERDTSPDVFHAEDGDVKTPFMRGANRGAAYKYDPRRDLSMLKIRYAGGEYSMLILMRGRMDGGHFGASGPGVPSANARSAAEAFPSSPDGLVKDAAEYLEISDILKEPSGYCGIYLSMPKFSIGGFAVNLNDCFRKMGIKKIFAGKNTDFAPLSPNLNAVFWEVVMGEMKSVSMIEVDEEGTKAASVSVSVSVGCSAAADILLDVKVDRPFAYFVVHNKSGLILFMGKIGDPSRN